MTKFLDKLKELDLMDWVIILFALLFIVITVIWIANNPKYDLFSSIAKNIGKFAGEIVEGFEEATK